MRGNNLGTLRSFFQSWRVDPNTHFATYATILDSQKGQIWESHTWRSTETYTKQLRQLQLGLTYPGIKYTVYTNQLLFLSNET